MAAIGMARRGLATGAAAPRTVLETAALVVKSLPVTPFEMNMYLLCCKATGDAAIIDAGDDDVDVWVAAAGDAGATIRHLVQTHGHVDHVAGLAAFKAALPDAPTYLHPLDDWIAAAAPAQGLAMGMRCPAPPPADVPLADGAVVRVGDVALDALHTPGHAPGHVAFHAAAHGVLRVRRRPPRRRPRARARTPAPQVRRRPPLPRLDRADRLPRLRRGRHAREPRARGRAPRGHGRLPGPHGSDDDRGRGRHEPLPPGA